MMVSEIAAFISASNVHDENFVGYCGTEPSELESTIRDFELPLEECFFILREGEKIKGLLGFDIDLEKSEAEVWGPFLPAQDWDRLALPIWRRAIDQLSPRIQKINFFFGSKNLQAHEFAIGLGAVEKSENSILSLSASRFHAVTDGVLPNLSAKHSDAFTSLHDSLFPSAYLNGHEIIQSIGDNHSVLTLEDNSELAGYIYTEVDPEHCESTIHFFGVHPESRGKGYGQKILRAGVEQILSHEKITEITLCVESENQQAIRLYERIGLIEKHRCSHFTLDL